MSTTILEKMLINNLNMLIIHEMQTLINKSDISKSVKHPGGATETTLEIKDPESGFYFQLYKLSHYSSAIHPIYKLLSAKGIEEADLPTLPEAALAELFANANRRFAVNNKEYYMNSETTKSSLYQALLKANGKIK